MNFSLCLRMQKTSLNQSGGNCTNKEIKRDYFVVIPAAVRFDKSLSPNAKLLYGDIWALCNKNGYCWATNGYFAEMYGCNATTVSVWISALEKNGYINTNWKNKKRCISVSCKPFGFSEDIIREINNPLLENSEGTLRKNPKHNNTYNNTLNNTINKKKESYDEILSEIKDNELRNLYYEFIKMRKMMHLPLTNKALILLIERVDSLSDKDFVKKEMLENAILKNQKTVYPPYKTSPKNDKNETNKYSGVMERVRAKRNAKFKVQSVE